MQDTQQPHILVGLVLDSEYNPGHSSILSALVVNISAELLCEVHLRFCSPDLNLSDIDQPRPLKLLDGQDALPAFLRYRAPEDPLLTQLSLEVDVCDQQGEWHAYTSRSALLLNFAGTSGNKRVKIRPLEPPTSPTLLKALVKRITHGRLAVHASLPAFSREQPTSPSLASLTGRWSFDPEQALPVTLEPQPDRTRLLRTTILKRDVLHRGSLLTRALLRCQNPAHAPERIELVSRPFIVMGRFNEQKNIGFGDFSLGFVTDPLRISRFHCALSAEADGLAVTRLSARDSSSTALNGQFLQSAVWQPVESGDELDICGLYPLRVMMAWDVRLILDRGDTFADVIEQLKACMTTVLELVQRADQGDTTAQQSLKDGYARFIALQIKATALNGDDSLGPLLYARLQREDGARYRVLHIYLPKQLPIGNSQKAGLAVNAPGVGPHQADLLYRNGMYWIQNRAVAGGVRVCSHNLAAQEAVPLEDGDTLSIGSARFVFEHY